MNRWKCKNLLLAPLNEITNMKLIKDRLNKPLQKDLQSSGISCQRFLKSSRDGILNLDPVNETRYRRLFESNLDDILILNPGNRKIPVANPFMVDLPGFSHDEFISKEL